MKADSSVCYGTATVGDKGQLVIPVEARKDMGIAPGDKILIFGSAQDVLALIKADSLSRMMSDIGKRTKTLNTIIRK